MDEKRKREEAFSIILLRGAATCALLICGLFLMVVVTGCGTKKNQVQQEQHIEAESTTQEEPVAEENGMGALIEDQTFDVSLQPFGQVTFASYKPDTSKNALADVTFCIEQDGKVLTRLPGITEDNVNSEMFHAVEAVSFLDYNYDDYDDIILIISYYLGAGPQAATPHSTIRYYSGNEDGAFSYQEQMSLDATSALAEVTIKTAKDFIGYKKPNGETAKEQSLEPWQEAYIQYLQQDSDVAGQDGYTLINMSKDESPLLVEVGNCEASGCRIVYFVDGKVHVTQLGRLNFTYIPNENLLCNSDGNMDTYYDLVYSIIDGEMTLIAQGYYGAKDNSNLKFDSEGNPIYQYEWNGVEMSKEEYGEELNRIYDTTKAVGYGYDNLYSVEEVIKAIEGYERVF